MKIRKWNGEPIDPDMVKRLRNQAAEYLKKETNNPFWYTISNDTLVVAIRHDHLIDIWHTKIVDKATLIANTRVVWEDTND